MSHLLKTLSALLVLSATLVTAPGSALAQAPGVGDLELPDLQPMLAWDRGLLGVAPGAYGAWAWHGQLALWPLCLCPGAYCPWALAWMIAPTSPFSQPLDPRGSQR